MTYIILLRFDGPLWQNEFIPVSSCTEEEAQAKAKEVYELNKDRFSEMQVALIKGEFVPLDGLPKFNHPKVAQA